MDAVRFVIDFILHIDVHLKDIVADYGLWTYGIVGLIVFCETGLVVTPFLPGDSLLFGAGALAGDPATGINVHVLAGVLFAAAVVGDAMNYSIGRRFGTRIAERFVKAAYLEQTRTFYVKYGGRAVILARFVPIVRTFAPFVAGMGAMPYRRYLPYNVAGALAWVGLFVYGGYAVGSNAWVKEHFSVLVLCVIAISVLPIGVELVRGWMRPSVPEAVEEAEAAQAARDAARAVEEEA